MMLDNTCIWGRQRVPLGNAWEETGLRGRGPGPVREAGPPGAGKSLALSWMVFLHEPWPPTYRTQALKSLQSSARFWGRRCYKSAVQKKEGLERLDLPRGRSHTTPCNMLVLFQPLPTALAPDSPSELGTCWRWAGEWAPRSQGPLQTSGWSPPAARPAPLLCPYPCPPRRPVTSPGLRASG